MAEAHALAEAPARARAAPVARPARVRTAATLRGAVRAPLLALAALVALLAALPRLAQVEQPITVDEPVWFGRTTQFAAAVAQGRWPGTFQTGHPGVTTMWLGTLGMGPGRAAALDGAALDLLAPEKQADFLAARRALALAASLLLALGALLAARAFGVLAGALAGVLLALEPWLVGHTRILHLDGLLSLLVAIAVLAALVRWRHGGGVGYVVLAGLAAGLAVLTKSSALALLPPMLLVLAVAGAWRSQGRGWWGAVADLALLGTVAALAAFAAWPALWADPFGTVQRVVAFGLQTGGEPHELGSYFLGRAVEDPGPAFYPVELAFRLGPLVVLGLGLWALHAAPRRADVPAAGVSSAGWLLLCAVLVVVVMGLAAKKQDRYVLPAVPLLAVVAAVGLRETAAGLGRRPAARHLVLGAVGLAQLALCAAQRPYYVSFYSPLLGGTAAAARMVPVGWGEGLAPLADYLNRQAGKRPSVGAPTSVRLALDAQTRVHLLTPRRDTGYLVTYLNAEQRGERAGPDMAREVLEVRLNGVEYARLYAAR